MTHLLPPQRKLLLIPLLALVLIPLTAAQPGSPDVSTALLEKPEPWDIQADTFRPGDTVETTFNVTDANGSADIRQVHVNISSPAGVEASYLTPETTGYITDGRTVTVSHTIPDTSPTGGWNITAWAVDRDGHTANSTTAFSVTSFSNVTLGLEYSISDSDSVYIDGQPASDGIYPAGGLDLPYIVSETPDIMAGLIGHSPLIQLGFTNLTGASYRMNTTLDFQDNQVLLPFTETDHTGLEQQSRYIRQPRLLSPPRYLAYPMDDLQDVIIEISYADTQIDLKGFTGQLGPGSHSILVKNRGKKNSQQVVEVIPS